MMFAFFPLIFLLLNLLFTSSLCETINEIENNSPKKESLASGATTYYMFKVPENITDESHYLLVKVTPNSELDAQDDIFSDPNLYISTTNKYPNNHHNSEWYSQRFGDEIITIDNKYVKPNGLFYIGVFCERKCNYILTAKLYTNYVMIENKLYGVTLKEDEEIRIKFKTKEEFNELSIGCIGMTLEPFRMYLAKENPSSSNTLQAFPTYFNGYKFNIVKGTSDYAVKTDYELLIQNQGKQNELRLWLIYDKAEIPLKQYDSFFETVKKYSNICFGYTVTKAEKQKTLILSFILFSGSGYIQIGGWKNIENMTYNEIPHNEYTYEIDSDKVIRITPEDFAKFDKEEGDENLHYCFFASETSSLITKAYFLESAEQVQRLNFLLPGKHLTDYLPSEKATRYSLLYMDSEKNLTISLENKQNNAKLYVLFCNEENCNVNKSRIDEEIKNRNVIEGFLTFNGYEITLTKTNNRCLDPNFTQKMSTCSVVAVVYCNSKTSECLYNLGYSHPDTITSMKPRTPYYNVLAYKVEDTYEIEIIDTEVKNLAIVLNQHTGEAELSVYKYMKSESQRKYIVDQKLNHDFLPNVITIKPSDLDSKDLKGKFVIKVKSKYFCSYTLYYYTFADYDTPSPDHTVISMKLKKGMVVQDFFQSNQLIKVYSFENKIEEGEPSKDLRIILTRINIYCSVFVFTDLKSYKFTNEKSYPIEGYTWKTDYSNEIIISKKDPYYVSNGEIYLVVYKNNFLKTKNQNDPFYSSFYIGITDEDTPFLLSEGMEHKTTLTSEYTNQTYYYNHLNISEPLSISFNLFYGKLDTVIYVDDKEYFSQTLIETTLISISTSDLRKFCKNQDSCGIKISIGKATEYNAQFLLICKRPGAPEQLTPGTVRTQRIISGEKHHYIIHATPNEVIGIRVSARFTNGNGNVYINKVTNTDVLSKMNWPDQANHQYEASQFSSKGKSIVIPYEDVKNFNPCQLLITVVGRSPSFDSNRIEYSISFSTDYTNINTNTNYAFYITTGETQFFSFRHEGFSKKLYISMSNKEGDADLYLNYGKMFPSLEEYNWKSTGSYTEFLELDKDDPYFVSKGLQEIEGDYSLMIYGYSNTSYNLFISSDENKIMVLTDDYPASCSCVQKNDMCYFRYESIHSFNIKHVYDKEIIFTIDYTYGNGIIYGKLFPDGNNANIIKNLPNERRYDFINDRRQNYLRVPLRSTDPRYTLDSTIVLGVKCMEKSLFEINSVKLKTDEDIEKAIAGVAYLDLHHDNVFYLRPKRPDSQVILAFYHFKEQDLNIEARAYSGEASITAYLNYSTYDPETEKSINVYHPVGDFEIKEGDYNSYYASVKKDKGYTHYLYMVVKPKTDVVFYVKLDFDTEWTRVPIGKMSNHLITKNVFNGYFDMMEDYEEVIITITNESPNKEISAYLKLNVIQKSEGDEKGYKYNIPSKTNFDQQGTSNKLLSTISFKVNNIPPEQRKESTSVRLLFTVVLNGYENMNTEEKLYIMVSPNVNHYRRVKTEQGMYYNSSISTVNKDKVVFNMLKKKKDDDLMIIEISSCQGDFDYELTNDISGNGDMKVEKVEASMKQSNGKKVISVSNLKNSDYYLSVWGTEEGNLQCLANSKECSKDIDFLLFYYTTNTQRYNQTIASSVFDYEQTGKGKIKINLPKLYEKDLYGNEQKIDMVNYTVIYTQNPEEFKYMESICYLSKMYEQLDSKEQKDIHYKYNPKSHTINVEGLVNNEKYFINVLITNPNTGEVLTFRPVQVIPSFSGQVSWFLIVMCGISIIFAILVALYFYKKYKKTDAKLQYEVNDIRNLGTIPKTVAEMKTITEKKEKEKYTTLTEDTQNI